MKRIKGLSWLLSASLMATLVLPTAAQTAQLTGDADKSGAVNTTDARLTLQFSAGKADETAVDTAAADVDGSGVTDTTDARLILQYCAGKLITFPADVSTPDEPTEPVAPVAPVAPAENPVASETATVIRLSGDTAVITGEGADQTAGDVCIRAAGDYVLSGTLTGRILVNAPGETVNLFLNGVRVVCPDNAALYVYKAAKVNVIVTGENALIDGAVYDYTRACCSEVDAEPNACLYSKADLALYGSGTLTVTANAQNGVTGKDALTLDNLTLNVTAVGHGVNGKDSLSVNAATLNVTADGDAVRSSNDSDTACGWITLTASTLTLTAGNDGVQAGTTLTVTDCALNITTGRGSGYTPSDSDESMKGLKASALLLTGGTATVDSSDDALHANGTAVITGGNWTLASGDDGVHADTSLTVTGGCLSVTRSYEGLESANITLSDAVITLSASDDGVNICGGNDGSGFGGRPGGGFSATDGVLTIESGTVSVNAGGDGLDSNGSIVQNGGTVLVDGPTGNGNGALDYNGTYRMNGGLLVAVGSSGMAQAPSASSAQCALSFTLGSNQPAGTLVHLATADGTDIVTFAPAKAYRSVVISSPLLAVGETYVLTLGGNCTGTAQSGLYTGGSCTGGTVTATVRQSAVITTNGGSGGFRPGF